MSLRNLDKIDKEIISLLQNDSTVTHSQIAKNLNRSQPAIGSRIKKLIDKGILATQNGVDFSKIDDLNLVILEISTSRPEKIMEMAQVCPYLINAIKISGVQNIIVFMACSSLKRLDNIIDHHFRSSPYISSISMNLVSGMANKFILPVDFHIEDFKSSDDPCHLCGDCEELMKLEK
ncbi:MAG: Lrp/AsnC family transcriptional regulator [Promethearchaeota archaeon]